MGSYQFCQSCRPSYNDLRINDVVQFLKLMQEAFGVTGWFGPREMTVSATAKCVEHALRSSRSPAKIEQSGAILVVNALDNQPPIQLAIVVGGDEWSRNSFDVNFEHVNFVPDLQFFRRSIEQIRPFEAMIIESQNDDEVLARLQYKPGPPYNDKPVVLHWFHYMNEEIADLVGGVEFCLKTPGFQVEKFCEGVLFQLTEEPFDADNPRHNEIQRQAMVYLGLE